MDEAPYEKIDKSTEDLKVHDEFRLGGMLMRVDRVNTNQHDERVLQLEILGARFKSRSKATLIIPKKLQITTLKAV